MDLETILDGIDAGFDVDQLVLIERLLRNLQDAGVTDEAEVFAAVAAAVHLQPEIRRTRHEMN